MRRIHRVLVLSAISICSAGTIATPVAMATATPHTTSRPNAPAAAATYVVKRGDNLAGIARKLKVTLADLLTTNSMTVTSVIHPGDVLVVPASGTIVASAAPLPNSSNSSAGAAPERAYVVRKGDALYSIATRHGVKLGPLLKANKLKIDSVVHPGATLIIPAGGTLVVSPSPAAPGQGNTDTVATAPAGPANAGSQAASRIDTVVAFATAQLGKPWKFNTAGPDTFDCSGLTTAAYAEVDVALPHQSAMQSTRGTPVDWRSEPIQAGDLVFMFNSSSTDVIGHVGIAVDAKRWIHAPRAGDVVRLGSLPSADKIQAVRRFIDA